MAMIPPKHGGRQRRAVSTSRESATRRLELVWRLADAGKACDLPRALELSYDRSSEIRMYAARAIGRLSGIKQAPRRLMEMTGDPNELVRSEVVEQLGMVRDKKARATLIRALSDRSQLVRGYAAAALGQLGFRKDRKTLAAMMRDERSECGRLGILQRLYWLGRYEVVDDITAMLKSRHYRTRCAAANVLPRLDRHASQSDILQALRAALKTEETVAARSSIKGSIRDLTDRQRRRP
jgi:HEAT repeat protein